MTFTSDPSTLSPEACRMEKDWCLIRTILNGTRCVREAGSLYLPRFPGEENGDFNARLCKATLSNHFRDAVETVSAKPFSQEVRLQGTISERIKRLAENVDRQGNNLHVFGRRAFRSAVSFGLHGIFVDFPPVPPGATLADANRIGASPYWVHVAADQFISVVVDFVEGRQRVVHARWFEQAKHRDGWGEVIRKRIRVVEPGLYEVYEEGAGGEGWTLIESGPMSLNEVPLALFYTGESDGVIAVRPPFLDLAFKQIEHYQLDSGLRNILDNTAFPMLVAEGMEAPVDSLGAPVQVPVGPRAVLYAPPNQFVTQPTWKWVEPAATSIGALQSKLDSIVEEMRVLGMQPLLPRSGTLLATVGAIHENKAHSAVQAWAVGFKDTIEQALKFSADWLEEASTAEAFVFTDFGVTSRDAQDIKDLIALRAAGDISRPTLFDELTRRSFLGPQFDADAEEGRLEQESLAAAEVNPADDPNPQQDPET